MWAAECLRPARSGCVCRPLVPCPSQAPVPIDRFSVRKEPAVWAIDVRGCEPQQRGELAWERMGARRTVSRGRVQAASSSTVSTQRYSSSGIETRRSARRSTKRSSCRLSSPCPQAQTGLARLAYCRYCCKRARCWSGPIVLRRLCPLAPRRRSQAPPRHNSPRPGWPLSCCDRSARAVTEAREPNGGRLLGCARSLLPLEMSNNAD